MLTLAATFWIGFAAGAGVLALTGHAISARWHVGSVSGWLFWWVLVTSPEILIFLFFMITDPRTAPTGRVARVVYAAAVAFFAALLMAPAQTEFWTKVAILGALTVVCAGRPLLERVLPPAGAADDRVHSWLVSRPAARVEGPRRWEALTGLAIVGVGLVVIAGIPARTANIPTLPRVEQAQIASRPEVHLPPRAVPPPTIDAGVQAIVPSLDRAQARHRAHDLVADLEIASDALARRDPRLAATAGAGTWLLDLQQQIATAGNDRPIDVPRYRLDSIHLVLVRRTGQSSPQVMLSVSGTVRTARYARADARPVLGPPTPYRRAYLMVPVRGVWLVVSAQLPP
jgi:hypothetical protein